MAGHGVMSAADFLFAATVGEAEVVDASALYTVTVRTNLADYAEHGEGPRRAAERGEGPQEAASAVEGLSGELDEEVQDDDDIFKLVTIPERTIIVKRSYSAFREVRRRGAGLGYTLVPADATRVWSVLWPLQLRDALCKSRVAGAASLPELPGKSLFAASAKDLALRRSAFASLLTHIGNNAELAANDATCAFLSGACAPCVGKRFCSRWMSRRQQPARSMTFVLCMHAEVPKPDFAVIHQDAMAAVREMLGVTDWSPRYTSKSGVEIATHTSPSSDLHMLRSTVLVPLRVDRAHAHYKARGLAPSD